MSIRYNRQYKRNVDIEGPIGPTTNDQGQNWDFLSNNDLYLNGGGSFGGGGGGGSFGGDVGRPDPTPAPVVPTPTNPVPDSPLDTPDPLINYELSIVSNLQNEIGNFLNLDYELVSTGLTTSGTLKLSASNTDGLKSNKSTLINGSLKLYLKNTLPADYSIKKIYYANQIVAKKNKTDYHWYNSITSIYSIIINKYNKR